jgi:hypothetical protein
METIQPIEAKDPVSGQVLMRNGIILAFFLEPFVYECSEALTAAFDLFVATVPAGSLKWAVVSATSEQWREVDANIMQRMRDSLAPTGARKRKFTAFSVNDFGDEPPLYSFTLSDRDKEEDQPVSRTLVQMTFPLSTAEDGNADTLYSLVAEFTALLKPAYGYCAPGLLQGDTLQMASFAEIRGFALRYPGYDVAVNDLTQLDIGSRVRGARWITILGPDLTDKLGGPGAFRKTLPLEVEIRDVAGTTMIRSGRTPELGNTNRKQETPLLRAVARVLEPVTLFGEVNLLSYFANFDEDMLRRWERRFLD